MVAFRCHLGVLRCVSCHSPAGCFFAAGIVGVWQVKVFVGISACGACGAGVLVTGVSDVELFVVRRAKVFFGRSACSVCVTGINAAYGDVTCLSTVKVMPMLGILLGGRCSVRYMMALT